MICLAQLASGRKFNLPAGTAWLSRPGSECSTGEDHDLSAGFPLKHILQNKVLDTGNNRGTSLYSAELCLTYWTKTAAC